MNATRHARIRLRLGSAGFTMLEALLALFIFSTAVIALLEAINSMGQTTLLARKERQVQDRLAALLLEATRSPERLSTTKTTLPQETSVTEGDVTYLFRTEPVALKNKEDLLLSDLISVTVTARWKEGATERLESSGTWIYLPLFLPTPSQMRP